MVSYTKICVALAAINMIGSCSADDFPATEGMVGTVKVTPDAFNGVTIYKEYVCPGSKTLTAAEVTDMRDLAGRAAKTADEACTNVVPVGAGDKFWGVPIGSYPDMPSDPSSVLFSGTGAEKIPRGKVTLSVDPVEGTTLSGSIKGVTIAAKVTINSGPCSATPAPLGTATLMMVDDGEEIESQSAAIPTPAVSEIDGGSVAVQGLTPKLVVENGVEVPEQDGNGNIIYENTGEAMCGDIVYLPSVRGYAAVWSTAQTGVHVEGRIDGLQKDGGDIGSFHVHGLSSAVDDASFKYPQCSGSQSIGDHLQYDGDDYWAQVGDASDFSQADTYNTYTSVGGSAKLTANLPKDKTSMEDLQYQALVIHTERSISDISYEQRVGCGNLETFVEEGGSKVVDDLSGASSVQVSVSALSALAAAGYVLLN